MNNSRIHDISTVILDLLPCDWMEITSYETVKYQQSSNETLSCIGIDTETVNMQAIIDSVNKDETVINDVGITDGIYLPNMFA